MPTARALATRLSVPDMRLSWTGRTWVPGAPAGSEAAPRIVVDEAADGVGGRLVRGDALDVARALAAEGLAGRADLVYLDPPFASQASYTKEARLDGAADGRVVRAAAYVDHWRDQAGGVGTYLDMLAPRLEAAARLVAPTGSIWVHLDWRAAYLVRVLMDEILGRHRFKNEIVWRRAPNLGRQATSGQFGRTLDTLVVYGGEDARIEPPTRLEVIDEKAVRHDDQGRPFTAAPRGDYTDASIRELEAKGRVHRSRAGKVYIKYFLKKNEEGAWCRERRVDSLWTDIAPLRHARPSERTGYPTQKPLALLDRIVRAATPGGGLVVDLFAGSGGAGEAAHACGRRFILGDAGAVAIATARARLLRARAPLSVESVVGSAPAPRGPRPTVRVGRTLLGAAVELVEPREPLAWAIDAAHDARGPFRARWHAERFPGKRTVPADALARLEVPIERLAVRVYGDDGSVAELVEDTA